MPQLPFKNRLTRSGLPPLLAPPTCTHLGVSWYRCTPDISRSHLPPPPPPPPLVWPYPQAVELMEASSTPTSGCASFCYSAAARRGPSLDSPPCCYSPTCRAFQAAREAGIAQAKAVRWIREQTKSLEGWELHRDARGIKVGRATLTPPQMRHGRAHWPGLSGPCSH